MTRIDKTREDTVFTHRSYLGWITDLATAPHPDAVWPSIELNDDLLADYRATFQTMQRLGMNEIVIWGLFVGGAWPPEIESAVDETRGRRLHQLLDSAHEHGISVLSGLGVYSWGFERIIAEHPHLSQGNPRAMCASRPDAWEWQTRVVDYVFNWPIDGISMQSADQGRCPCAECAALGDVAYHAALNARVADYVRSVRPAALVGVNNWGMTFADPADLPLLVDLGHHVDYIIDAHDTAGRAGRAYRQQVIAAVPCGWGTIGGYSVEPPQHWRRDRWFLPCLASVAHHVRALADDGATACEQFFRITANPGDEVSMHVAGRMLGDPTGDWRAMLRETVRELYVPASGEAEDELVDLFVCAEAAYFDNATQLERIGTLSMEPLVSSHEGEPVYLLDHMDDAALSRYATQLQTLQSHARALQGRVGAVDRLAMIERCLDGVLGDVTRVRSLGGASVAD